MCGAGPCSPGGDGVFLVVWGPEDVPFQKLYDKTGTRVCQGQTGAGRRWWLIYLEPPPLPQGMKLPLGTDGVEGHWGQKEG